jgi:glutathione S-transferase
MAKLTANRQWAAGDSFGLGDIAVGTALGYLSIRFAELNWQASYPDLVRLSERLETRPSFKNSVPCAQTITDKVM